MGSESLHCPPDGENPAWWSSRRRRRRRHFSLGVVLSPSPSLFLTETRQLSRAPADVAWRAVHSPDPTTRHQLVRQVATTRTVLSNQDRLEQSEPS